MEIYRKPVRDDIDMVVTVRMFNTIITLVDDKRQLLLGQW